MGDSTPGRRVVLVGKRRAAKLAARRLGHRVTALDIVPASGDPGHVVARMLDLADERLAGKSPDAVIAVVEGSVRAAAALRERYGLPGITAEVAERCHDKIVMKRAASSAGIRCAPWFEIGPDTRAREVITRLGLPVVLKQPVGSGGRGIAIVDEVDELEAALRPGLLAEGFVGGVEMSVETLLCDGEVLFQNGTRYLVPRWESVVPAALSTRDAEAAAALCRDVHAALGIRDGMTHLELFLRDDGPVFGEIAARPPGGYLMELIELSYGFDPWAAVIELGLGGRPELVSTPQRYAGVRLIHPGAGVVARVDGSDRVAALPGVHRMRLDAEPGQVIAERVGSGQSIGEIVTVAATHDDCVARIEAARHGLRIEMEPLAREQGEQGDGFNFST